MIGARKARASARQVFFDAAVTVAAGLGIVGLSVSSGGASALLAPTTTGPSSSQNPAPFGQALTLSATVAQTASGGATPSGTVTFTDTTTNTPLGDATVLPRYATGLSVRAHYSCFIEGYSGSEGIACWGQNTYGQLGDGTTQDRSTPVHVAGIKRAFSVSAGGYHTCALDDYQTTAGGGWSVKCWGNNYYGQLGNGSTVDSPTAITVPGLEARAIAVAAGEFHSCALLNDASIVCWGRNNRGQLGDGTTDDRLRPARVSGLSLLAPYGVDIQAGAEHTCAGIGDGALRCWGANDYGQLGNGTIVDSLLPTQVVGLTHARQFSVGWFHTCALEFIPENETSYANCWGSGSYGAIGDGTYYDRTTPQGVWIYLADPQTHSYNWQELTNLRSISAGDRHTCAVMPNGDTTCWGSNSNGQLGDGTNYGSAQPITPYKLGENGAVAISAGTYHTCAILDETGSPVQCWGSNDNGELGDGTTMESYSPVTTASFGYATLEIPALHGGSHVISASYSGDSANDPSSGSFTQVIERAATTVTLTAPAPATTFGQSVTFTATVSSAAGTPTGNVLFRDGTATLGIVALSGGVASFTANGLAGGLHSISATYEGTQDYAEVNPVLLAHTINPAATSIAVTSSPNPSVYGSYVTFNVTVSSSATGMTGTVTFTDTTSGTTLGSAGVTAGGTTYFSTSALAAGHHEIAVSYGGNINFQASSGVLSGGQTVSTPVAYVGLSSSPNPSAMAQPVTLTATVSGSGAGPTGSVTFRDGTTTLGTASLSGGVATLTTSSLGGWVRAISADYSGDGTYPASSATVAHTVLMGCGDSFSGTAASSMASGTAAGSTVGATGEGGEPNHAGTAAPLNSVWCAWTAPISGPVTFDTTGSNFDTTLAVYTGGSVGGLTQVAASDNIAPNNLQSRVAFNAVQGTTYHVAVDGAGSATGNYLLNWSQTTDAPTLASAVLPTSRSVVINTAATAYATLINTGAAAATGCGLYLPFGFPATFIFQTTDAANVPVGTPNTLVDIPAGGVQSFYFGIAPTVLLDSADVAITFACTNANPAPSVAGLNTLSLSAAAVPTPDLVAIGATPSNDGVVRMAAGGSGFFAAAAINIGSGDTIVASVDDNGKNLPLVLSLCRTDPATGACVNPAEPADSVTTTFAANETGTFTVFVRSTGPVPFDPANSRLFLRLRTLDGVVRGATSVAVLAQ